MEPTDKELFTLAHSLAKETAAEEGRLLPPEQGRPVVTTGGIVRAAYQLGLDAGGYRAGLGYLTGYQAGRRHAELYGAGSTHQSDR